MINSLLNFDFKRGCNVNVFVALAVADLRFYSITSNRAKEGNRRILKLQFMKSIRNTVSPPTGSRIQCFDLSFLTFFFLSVSSYFPFNFYD